MSKSYDFGRFAEREAERYLSKKSYTILERNYRYQRAEIDIIAQKEKTLIIVEVKARTTTYFGNPKEAIGEKKIRLLCEAANHYVIDKDLDVQVQFDIISIVKNKGDFSIEHIKDAFMPL